MSVVPSLAQQEARERAALVEVHRSVDPSDGRVYVWTSFEPDDARRAWPCFDQPDLKAVFAFTVDAPADRTVLSSSGDPVVTDVGAGRRWAFPDTPRLSTYVPALSAGPLHVLRHEVDGHDPGLAARQPLAGQLERDADELFTVTAHAEWARYCAATSATEHVDAWASFLAGRKLTGSTLDDLLGALARASGRDTAGWQATWLGRAATDVLCLADDSLHASGPDGTASRPHRVDIGATVRGAAGPERREVLSLDTVAARTALPPHEPADLQLLNDGDLTLAVVRADEARLAALLASAADLPTAVARTLAVTTAWQLVVPGELAAGPFVRCALSVLLRERVAPVREPLLTLTVQAAALWSPDVERAGLESAVADVCIAPAAGTDRRQVAARALARTAGTEEQLAALEALAGDDDVDLRWRRLQRLAVLGRLGTGDVAALQAVDPDPDAALRARVVRAALPDAGAKAATREAGVGGRTIPLGVLNLVVERSDELRRMLAARG